MPISGWPAKFPAHTQDYVHYNKGMLTAGTDREMLLGLGYHFELFCRVQQSVAALLRLWNVRFRYHCLL